MANVFYSTFLNVFYSCHVFFTFFNVFYFSWTVFYIYVFNQLAMDIEGLVDAQNHYVTDFLALEDAIQ